MIKWIKSFQNIRGLIWIKTIQKFKILEKWIKTIQKMKVIIWIKTIQNMRLDTMSSFFNKKDKFFPENHSKNGKNLSVGKILSKKLFGDFLIQKWRKSFLLIYIRALLDIFQSLRSFKISNNLLGCPAHRGYIVYNVIKRL